MRRKSFCWGRALAAGGDRRTTKDEFTVQEGKVLSRDNKTHTQVACPAVSHVTAACTHAEQSRVGVGLLTLWPVAKTNAKSPGNCNTVAVNGITNQPS